ncbi:DUF1496 domain-containing protein [Glaciecola sp. 2405UD65-10]|uniref:DUF1496 domain-containing protein n=1 Tax=Glaciecola sp. 2405UD65-10 TaxID=3397244 RepID=UPI003B59F8F9
MKKQIFALAASMLVVSVNASEKIDSTEIKAINEAKFCYYADREYSEGSRMLQAGRTMQCIREDDGAKLVWQALEQDQL